MRCCEIHRSRWQVLEIQLPCRDQLLGARWADSETLKRLITHSSVGTGNGVAVKGLPPDCDIWADIHSQDVFEGAASRVI